MMGSSLNQDAGGSVPRPGEDDEVAIVVFTGETSLKRFVSDFTDNKVAVGALFVFIAIMFVAIFCPLISPQDPYDLAVIDICDSLIVRTCVQKLKIVVVVAV